MGGGKQCYRKFHGTSCKQTWANDKAAAGKKPAVIKTVTADDRSDDCRRR
jgi:hypothetical protein